MIYRLFFQITILYHLTLGLSLGCCCCPPLYPECEKNERGFLTRVLYDGRLREVESVDDSGRARITLIDDFHRNLTPMNALFTGSGGLLHKAHSTPFSDQIKEALSGTFMTKDLWVQTRLAFDIKREDWDQDYKPRGLPVDKEIRRFREHSERTIIYCVLQKDSMLEEFFIKSPEERKVWLNSPSTFGFRKQATEFFDLYTDAGIQLLLAKLNEEYYKSKPDSGTYVG